MTENGKLPTSLILTLGTLGLIGSMAFVGLIYTIRWAMALPAEIELSAMFPTMLFFTAKIVLQFLAGLAVFLAILYGTRKVAFRGALISVGLLLLLHIVSWVLAPTAPTDMSFLAKYGLRIGFAAWLVALLFALGPNNSSKPNGLRPSA